MRTALKKTDQKGFTLIELLIVIAIIGFLAAAVLVAVDPVKRIQDSRDARAFAEVNALLNAILTKQVDDRALFTGTQGSGLAGSPVITQTVANQVQVITNVDGTATTCSVAATKPLCGPGTAPGAITYTTVGTPTDDCIANLSGTLTGTGTASSAAAVVTGTGTQFVVEARVGDTLTSASGGTCVVQTITSATSITCTATPSPVFAGVFTITSSTSLVPNYIASLPIIPNSSSVTPATGPNTGNTNTGYFIRRSAGNRIEIGDCWPEQTAPISVKR